MATIFRGAQYTRIPGRRPQFDAAINAQNTPGYALYYASLDAPFRTLTFEVPRRGRGQWNVANMAWAPNMVLLTTPASTYLNGIPIRRIANDSVTYTANVAAGLINRQFGPKAQFRDVTDLPSDDRSVSGGVLVITQAEWDAMT